MKENEHSRCINEITPEQFNNQEKGKISRDSAVALCRYKSVAVLHISSRCLIFKAITLGKIIFRETCNRLINLWV